MSESDALAQIRTMVDAHDIDGLIEVLRDDGGGDGHGDGHGDGRGDDWRVRWAAAQALGQLAAPQAVEPLLTALDRPEPVSCVRLAVVEALGEIGDPRAVQRLGRALHEWNLQWEAGRALARLGLPGRSMLHETLADADPYIRRIAAFELAEVGHVEGIGVLVGVAREDENAGDSMVDTLRHLLERAAGAISHEDLLLLAQLDGVIQIHDLDFEDYGEGYHSEDRVTVDCSRVRQLAQEELARRASSI